MKNIVYLAFLVVLSGCTYNQSKMIGINQRSVRVYAQKMSNLELCDTLYYRRTTNQTAASIGAEFNRRKLSKGWCDIEMNQWYPKRVTKWAWQLLDSKEQVDYAEISAH